MKTLVSMYISLLLTGAIKAQQINPEPPATGTWTAIRAAQVLGRLRQPPMPAGGFWVVEDKTGQKGPTIIRYYNDQRQELRTEVLARKRLNIKKKIVVLWLNEQLNRALAAQAIPELALHR